MDVFVRPPQRGVDRNPGEFPLQQPQDASTAARTSKKGFAIEIAGHAPCSGKTQLLYYIAANCLLPSVNKDIVLDHKGGTVVWFDTDGRFSTQRLHQILSQQLERRLGCADLSTSTTQTASLTDNASAALHHLHVFRPKSTPSFLSSLTSLSSYLLNPTLHFSASRPLSLIVVSNLSAFLGQDRMDAESEPTTAGASVQPGTGLFTQRYIHIISILRSVQSTFGCTIITGNWGLSPIQHSLNGPSLRPHLPAVWYNLCTLRLVTERDGVSKFGPGMSAEEALMEGNQRQEAVEKSRFSCWVNRWASDEWEDGVSERLRRLRNHGGFCFNVSEAGVVVHDVEASTE